MEFILFGKKSKKNHNVVSLHRGTGNRIDDRKRPKVVMTVL